MKRFILIAALLLPVSAQAAGLMMSSGTTVSSTVDAGLVHSDTWDASTNPEDNWDLTSDPNADGSVDAGVYQGGSGKSFKIVGGDADNIYLEQDMGSDETEVYVQFYAYWDTTSPGSSNSNSYLMYLYDAGIVASRIEMRYYWDASGSPNAIRLYYRTDSGLTYDSAGFTASKDTWYKFKVRYKVATSVGANNGAAQLWIDDVLSSADQTAIDNDTISGVGAARLGVPSTGNVIYGNFYYDSWEWRTDDSF